MRPVAILFCALALLGPAVRATPADDFVARGKELLANKAKLSDADRLHRLFDFSWEYTMKESPEFATLIGYPGQNDRWSDVSFAAIARRRETNKLDLELITAIDRAKLPESDRISYDLYRRNAEFAVEGDQFPFELLQINQMSGVQQNVAQMISHLQDDQGLRRPDRAVERRARVDRADDGPFAKGSRPKIHAAANHHA